VLWKFDVGRPVASGPTIFSAGGKEYIAVTVGGTPTSSNGGLAALLSVFALPGKSKFAAAPSTQRASAAVVPRMKAPARATLAAAAGGKPRIEVGGGAVGLALWQASNSNEAPVSGRILLGGRPVQGARVSVDRFTLPRATDARGVFTANVDRTLARRHPIKVVDASHASVGGKALTEAQQHALSAASGGISVGYRIVDARATVLKNGNVQVTGRAVRTDGGAAPGVVQLSYRLQGTITDSSGKPVQGATVVTRTTDRDFWTFSLPTDANGHYVSFFSASDEQGSDPVPLNVQVAYGRTSYGSGQSNANFKRLSSATMNIKLPASGATIPVPTSAADAGAYWRGLLVGVAGPKGVVKPVSATWPDARGRFTLVLPRQARGTTLRFWESDFVTFSRVAARPGGPTEPSSTPRALTNRIPVGLATVRVG
jgi:hypothetical protein